MSAADAYRSSLSGGELIEFSVAPLDRTGVPVWNATRLAPGEPTAKGFGYGLTDEEAQLSALGETVETHHAARAIPRLERVHGSYRELRARGAVDPVSLVLPAGADYDADRELAWVPGRRWGSDEPVLLPVEAVATEPAELGPDAPPPLFTPITNGLGAGETLERAVVHGLLELVQRDGNSVTQRALDHGVAVDVAGLDEPVLRRLDGELGIELQVKANDSDLGAANVSVVGCERDLAQVPFGLVVTAGGEAAHPDRAKAIRKAALEFCASRARKALSFGPLELVDAVAPSSYRRLAREADPAADEPRALEAMLEWVSLDAAELRERIEDPVLTVRRTIGLDELPDTPVGDDPADVLAVMLERLRGFDVLWVDLSPPGREVRVVKMLVPGLEVETASYARIGARNLRRLLERDSGLVGLGVPPDGAAAIHLPEGHAPAWLHLGRLHETVRDLYALYREPGRHVTANLLTRR